MKPHLATARATAAAALTVGTLAVVLGLTGERLGVPLALGGLALGLAVPAVLAWPRRRRRPTRHAAAPARTLGQVVPLPRWQPAGEPVTSTPIDARTELAARLRIPTQRVTTTPTTAARASAASSYSARWTPPTPYDRGNLDPRRPRYVPPR
jgi:hypothetical protein